MSPIDVLRAEWIRTHWSRVRRWKVAYLHQWRRNAEGEVIYAQRSPVWPEGDV